MKLFCDYVPLTTQTMHKAAEFWANLRKQGKSTAHDKALDGDIILAAQAVMLEIIGHEVTVAITNVGHISRLVNAKTWREIF